MAKTPLNIYLAKEGITPEDVIKPHLLQELRTNNFATGRLYWKNVDSPAPKWVKTFFNEEIKPEPFNKTIQAAYITQITDKDGVKRTFAITFGLGRNLLQLNKFEERFGKICALNLVGKEQLRIVDFNEIGTNPKAHRTQISRQGGIENFILNRDQDMTNKIVGSIPTDSLLDVKSVSGSQSLSLNVTVDYHNIQPLLLTLFEFFQSEAYLEKFPGIDAANKVKSRDKIEQLDSKLIELLADPNQNNISLSIPEIVEQLDRSVFKYGTSDKSHHNLDLEELLSDLRESEGLENPTIANLKNIHISQYNDNDIRIDSWKIYKCLVAEISGDNNNEYILHDGTWYEINTDFAKAINERYNNIEQSTIDLGTCKLTETETSYNKRISGEKENFIHMDCKLLNPLKQNSPFEICDIFDTESKSLIHVKKGNVSSKLSHLFNQGLVSGQLLNLVPIREKIAEEHLDLTPHIPVKEFLTSDYTIVLAIITNKAEADGRPHLPFFSRITLTRAVVELQNYGYKVSLARIPDENPKN